MKKLIGATVLGLSLALGLGACKKAEAPVVEAVQTRTFPIHGEVKGFQAEGKVVILKHDKVEGLMDGMTMGFELADGVGKGLKVGDIVNGTLSQSADSYVITELKKQ